MNDAEERKVIRQEADHMKMERAIHRHKRRVRNQIIVYLVVGIFFATLVALAYIGGTRLVSVISERRVASEKAKEAEAAEISAQEEEVPEIIIPEKEEETVQEEEEPLIFTPQTEEPEVAENDDELMDQMIDEVISGMTLKEKVAGLFITTPEQFTGVDAAIKAGDGTKSALENTAIGGLIYSQKNIKTRDQIAEMISKTEDLSKYPLFLGISELGADRGDLTNALQLEQVPSPAELAESGDVDAAYEAGQTIAKRMVDVGFQMNLGPYVDLTTIAMSDKERQLSYGSDPSSAALVAASEIRGMEENGVHTSAHLFPSSVDQTSDGNIPSTGITKDEFAQTDALMFQAAFGAGTKIVVVGNMAAPLIVGDKTPCTMSSVVMQDMLRGELGFDGIIMTEAMNTQAITDYYTPDQAAVAALKAGADMICCPEDLEKAIDGVLDAVNSGELSEAQIEESLKRIYRVKYAYRF